MLEVRAVVPPVLGEIHFQILLELLCDALAVGQLVACELDAGEVQGDPGPEHVVLEVVGLEQEGLFRAAAPVVPLVQVEFRRPELVFDEAWPALVQPELVQLELEGHILVQHLLQQTDVSAQVPQLHSVFQQDGQPALAAPAAQQAVFLHEKQAAEFDRQVDPHSLLLGFGERLFGQVLRHPGHPSNRDD